jgi:hypothetical protein
LAQTTIIGHRPDTLVGGLARVNSRVNVTTGSIMASFRVRGALGRGSSSSPSRWATNRLRHFPTHCLVKSFFSATTEFFFGTRTQKNDACSLRQGLCRLGSSRPLLQCLTFLRTQNKCWDRTSTSHVHPPFFYPTDVRGYYLFNEFKGQHATDGT